MADVDAALEQRVLDSPLGRRRRLGALLTTADAAPPARLDQFRHVGPATRAKACAETSRWQRSLVDGIGQGTGMTGSDHVRTMPPRGRQITVVVSMMLGLSACGDRAKVKSPAQNPISSTSASAASAGAGATAAAQNLTPPERYRRALSLMQQGQSAAATSELTLIQQVEPGNRRVAMLLRQLDTDPRQLYGADSFVITLKAGDTLFSLARKYLRDPLNFYGLARFNNLVPPVDLKPGQTFLIPGRPRVSDHVSRRPQPSTAKPAVAPADAPATTTQAPPETAADRGEAQKLRAEGLEQMSAGSIDRAVTLLSQAASLDPKNDAIARDLARARRIQATVRSR